MKKANKGCRRLLSFMMSAAIAGTMTAAVMPDSMTVFAATAKTPDEITYEMGLGWNLGNSLESTGRGYSDDITQYETMWGNPVVTEDLIDAVKAKGFNTIRIPITWYEHITLNNGVYTIEERWLQRVKTVVDYAYSRDMYVIINVHHENWIDRSDFVTAYNDMSPKLKDIWAQVAAYFSDYDQHLIFEGMNEPRAKGTDLEWTGGNAACHDVVNKLNSDFVDTVRSVSSPYKNTRLLMIPGYAASCDHSVYKDIIIPDGNDSNGDGYDDYVAISIHAYSPYDFTMGDGDHSSFSDTYKAALAGIFGDIRTCYTSNDIPVVIGEFSASNYDNLSARKSWATYYITTAKQMGIPCVLWDNNVPTNAGNPGEVHGYLDRSSNTWYSQSEAVVNCMLNVMANDDIVWDSRSKYPIYSHNALSSGTAISISSDGYINDAVPLLGENTEIAVSYSSAAPKMALSNSSWGGWTEISPSDMDPKNKIAYYSFSLITGAWNTNNGVLANLKLVSGDPTSAYLLSFTDGEEVIPTPDPDPEPSTDIPTFTYEQVIFIDTNGQTISGYSTESIKLSDGALSSDKDIAVYSNGSVKIALTDSEWKNWKEVSPYRTGDDYYYFSYSDIMSVCSATSSTAYIYIIGQGSTFYKISAVPAGSTPESSTGEITLEMVNAMTKSELIAYVKTFESSGDIILTPVQERAVERLLELDLAA